MPHGLSMDSQGNLWLTDVAMHQVFKYSDGEIKMTLGEAFVPGHDEKHFCKPTDVAVSNDGSAIFVADGYCNSRLVKFDAKGNFARQYSMKTDEKQLLIPHSLDLICVADRENGRSLSPRLSIRFDGGKMFCLLLQNRLFRQWIGRRANGRQR